jgi:hypothetical protein
VVSSEEEVVSTSSPAGFENSEVPESSLKQSSKGSDTTLIVVCDKLILVVLLLPSLRRDRLIPQ